MRIIMLLCCCFCISISLLAQEASSVCGEEPAHVHQITKKEGWTVPGLEGSNAFSQRISDGTTGAAKIFRTQLTPPNGEVLVELPYYTLKCGQLEIKQQ